MEEMDVLYLKLEMAMSIYFHKNKKHYASCDGGLFGGGSYKSYANAGQWAVAYCKAGWAGKKTNYGDS